jgi:hypothetical protein
MQVRCYACGLKLHDGMPRLEELSSVQYAVATLGTEAQMEDRPTLVLDHPHFQGMSLHSFCSDCQDLILTLPVRAWSHDIVGHTWSQAPRPPWGHPDHFTVPFECKCGHPLGTSLDTPAANRAWRVHDGGRVRA